MPIHHRTDQERHPFLRLNARIVAEPIVIRG